MKTQQTPLNTPQPDTKDVQATLDRDKASTRKLHAEVQQIIANRDTPAQAPQQTQKPMQTRSAGQQFAENYSDQPRHALELRYLEEIDQLKAHAQRLADALKLALTFCENDAMKRPKINPMASITEAIAQWEGNKNES